MRKGTEWEMQILIFSEIVYKSKPEFLDQFLSEMCRDIRQSFVVVRVDEIFNFWITSLIETDFNVQPKAQTWLYERRHMSQEYPDGYGRTVSWTGFVRKTPDHDWYLNERR